VLLPSPLCRFSHCFVQGIDSISKTVDLVCKHGDAVLLICDRLLKVGDMVLEAFLLVVSEVELLAAIFFLVIIVLLLTP